MATPMHNSNGHRRRELVKRVKAEETRCALCDKPVDKGLRYKQGEHGKQCPTRTCAGCIPHPQSGEVDEDIPRSRGGSPYDRSNCHLMHRECNGWKSAMTLAEARAKLHGQSGPVAPVKASPIW